MVKKVKKDWKSISKKAGQGLLGLFVLVLLFSLVNNFLDRSGGFNSPFVANQSFRGDFASDEFSKMTSSFMEFEEAEFAIEDGAVLPPVEPVPVAGNDAEEFEVKEYNVRIDSSDLDETCVVFEDLKPLDYVIFENANIYETGCSYTFKVENDRVEEVVKIIESLDPRSFSENRYTIKKVVENYTSEIDILERKAEVIDQTLEEAIASYNQLTELATSTRNAETLETILSSKLSIVERLSNERINNASRLERIAKNRAEQLDRLAYTNFYVNVNEVKIVDGQDLKDSWMDVLNEFFDDINTILQDVSVNLLVLLLLIVQYGIYFIVLVFAAKYLWKFAKYIWKK